MAKKSFVANVTPASFVQRDVARDSVTEGLFFAYPTKINRAFHSPNIRFSQKMEK